MAITIAGAEAGLLGSTLGTLRRDRRLGASIDRDILRNFHCLWRGSPLSHGTQPKSAATFSYHGGICPVPGRSRPQGICLLIQGAPHANDFIFCIAANGRNAHTDQTSSGLRSSLLTPLVPIDGVGSPPEGRCRPRGAGRDGPRSESLVTGEVVSKSCCKLSEAYLR